MTTEATYTYPELRCPIPGCTWTFCMPRVPAYETYGAVLALAEVLAHITSRSPEPDELGYPQERTHDLEEISALSIERILEAAQLPTGVRA